MKCLIRLCSWVLLLGALACANLGCKSADIDNTSSRPWNTPRGFDTGLPGYNANQFR